MGILRRAMLVMPAMLPIFESQKETNFVHVVNCIMYLVHSLCCSIVPETLHLQRRCPGH